mgnify:CR=1 FL=1
MSVVDYDSSRSTEAFDPDRRIRPEAERFGRGLVFGGLTSLAAWGALIVLFVR